MGDRTLLLAVGAFFAICALLWARALTARRSPWSALLPFAMVAWPLVLNGSDARIVTYEQYSGNASLEMGSMPDVLKLPSWAVTALFVAFFASGAFVRGWKAMPRPARELLGAFLLFCTAPILAVQFGTPGGGFDHGLVRPMVFVPALLLLAAEFPDEVLRTFKYGALFWVAVSLALAVVVPEWALFETGPLLDGPLPFPRLYGIASHPNKLGPLSLVYLYLEYRAPSPRWLRAGGVLAAGTALFMAQSKTSWVIAAVAGAVLLHVNARGLVAWLAKWFASVGAVAAAAWAVLARWDELWALIESASFTGRTELWRIALAAWQGSPWFGYGPTLWNEDFRRANLGVFDAASHSHNMYVQQLAETGIVGALLMLVFLLVLVRWGWRSRLASRGLSLVVVLHVLVACLTESALSVRPMGEPMMVLTAILVLIVDCATRWAAPAPVAEVEPVGEALPVTW